MKGSTNESTQFLCEILNLSRAGFYEWRRRKELPDFNDVLRSKIVTLHQKTKGRYGVERIYHGLKNEGETASRNRGHRQMKQLGVRGKVKKRFIPKTTINNPSAGKSPRIFEGNATAVTRPNEVWATSPTFIRSRVFFTWPFGSTFFRECLWGGHSKITWKNHWSAQRLKRP